LPALLVMRSQPTAGAVHWDSDWTSTSVARVGRQNRRKAGTARHPTGVQRRARERAVERHNLSGKARRANEGEEAEEAKAVVPGRVDVLSIGFVARRATAI